MSDAVPIALNDIELDALTELVNLGVSRAAVGLRTMVGHEVSLSVPRIAIVPRDAAALTIGEHELARLVAVSQEFEGDFSGRALLIFPETKCLELVRAVTGGALPLEDIVSMEQEALAETGNIILNGCLSTIANMLRRSLRTSLPNVLRGNGKELFEISGVADPDDVVLVLYIDFVIDARDITGYIALLMDLPALRTLRDLLRVLVDRTAEPVPLTDNVAD